MTAPYLTDTQYRVLLRFAEGATCPQVARELGVSEVTVRGYSLRIRRSLDATTIAHAVHRAHQLGLLKTGSKRRASVLPAVELEVLRLVASGLSNADIAGRLGRSEYTVAEQVKQLRGRLGARDRGHAVALAMASGLLVADDLLGSSSLPPAVDSA